MAKTPWAGLFHVEAIGCLLATLECLVKGVGEYEG